MRNSYCPWTGAILLSLVAFTGCTSRPASAPGVQKSTLQSGYDALEARQYEQALAQADGYLQSNSRSGDSSAGTAAALYLRGRSYEGRVAADQAQAQANLQSARTAYIQCLSQKPGQPLAAYARTSLANVAYFQDDYATALAQWSAAYDALDRGDVKSWVLYRIGICQQRMGQFEQADKTFAQ